MRERLQLGELVVGAFRPIEVHLDDRLVGQHFVADDEAALLFDVGDGTILVGRRGRERLRRNQRQQFERFHGFSLELKGTSVVTGGYPSGRGG